MVLLFVCLFGFFARVLGWVGGGKEGASIVCVAKAILMH